MTIPAAVGVALLAGGAIVGAPGIALLGVLSLATTWVSTLWSQHGLRAVTYERRLAADRVVWGDEVELSVAVTNGKLLPLAWLEADDFATEDLAVRERPLVPSERPGLGILRNVWSLAPFERSVRHLHIVADRRGLFRFGPVRLRVADLFGRDVASVERQTPATLVVRPRSVPVRTAGSEVTPVGPRRARHGLHEDPALFAGVRPYQRGDPRRRIHPRATARVGRPVSKRFEPSTVREVVVALDVQTLDGSPWMLAYDPELVESLAVAAASLVRRFIADGAACGLVANGWTATLARYAFVPPGTGPRQLTRVLDVLGRLSSSPSTSFGRVLAELPGRLPTGALIVALVARDPAETIPTLRRLAASGHPVRLLTLGPDADAWARRARAAGLEAVTAGVRPDWRTTDALVLAG